MGWSPPDYSTASLSVVPEPHTVIFDELFVCPFVLYFLNRGDGNLDETPALMASHEQSIEGEIRTLLEREKILDRDDTVQVFYRCLERRPDGLSNRYDSVVRSA